MKKNTKRFFFSFSTHFVAFLLGILAFYATYLLSSYLNRPIISSNCRMIVLRETLPNDWEIEFDLKLLNTGNSSTIIEVDNIQFLFPQYSSKPLLFAVNEYVRLESHSEVIKKIKTNFPAIFKFSSLNNPPLMDSLVIQIKDQSYDKSYYLSKDSTYISNRILFGPEYKGLETLPDAVIDSVSKKITVETKLVYLDFKGKSYRNTVYPRNANISYKIKDDKIHIAYSLSAKGVGFNKEQLFEPFMFFPHKDLEDKIVYPNTIEVQFQLISNKSNRTSYENVLLEVGINQNQIVFLID